MISETDHLVYRVFRNAWNLFQEWIRDTKTTKFIKTHILFNLVSKLEPLSRRNNPRQLVFIEDARNDRPRFVRKLAVVMSKNFAIFQKFQVYVE